MKTFFDRVIITLPHITSVVNDWLFRFPRFSTASHSSGQHCQLSGDIALRSTRHALKLRDSIQHHHCESNPFIVGTTLKSIVSSVLIPEAAKEDIFRRDEKGLDGYRKFVKERLVPDAPLSVWSTMKKMKLKTFSTWMAKTLVSVRDKVIKLREERQFLARFLVIQQSHPKLVPRLPVNIGNYEMSVTPRSKFVSDGSLFIPIDKASIIHAVEEANPIWTEIQTLTETMFTHNHEEADTMIPLHAIDTIGKSTLRDIDVWSPDANVLILQMDLVAHGRLGVFTKLNFLTGKGDKYRSINIRECLSVIGREKCQGLIGFHNFTGADWGGKFVGISKKSWITSYLS